MMAHSRSEFAARARKSCCLRCLSFSKTGRKGSPCRSCAGATLIDRLNPRWRRQFPYERYNRWSQSPDEKQRWTKALEAEGVEAVRRALQQSRAGSPGLIRIGDTSMTQGFAEQWLDWRDARKPNW